MTLRTIAIFGVIGALGLGVAGCQTPLVFQKSGVTNQEFAADKLDCVQTTNATSGNSFAFGPPMFVLLASAAASKAKQDVYNTCMEAHGYEIVSPH